MNQATFVLPRPTSRSRRGNTLPSRTRNVSRWFAVFALLLFLAVAFTFQTVPSRNYPGQPTDVLLVLGSPATSSGAMTPMQYWRVVEAVREYQRGQAAYILFTGGAAANRFVESSVMREGAIRMGVPPEAILTETSSRTTLENLCNSLSILHAHRWSRVEVISSPEHLHRAAVLLGHTGLLWTVHPSSVAFRPWWKGAIAYVTEAVGTTLVRWFGLRTAPAMHRVSKWFNLQVWRVRVTWNHLSGKHSGTDD